MMHVRNVTPGLAGSPGGSGAYGREPRALASLLPSFSQLSEDTPLQRKKAVELQQQWGNKPCDHPAFSREYDLGERTGNYCCTQCGASLTFREKAELTAAREAKRGRPRGD